MKKLYFLCLTALIGFSSFAQTTLYQESFETDTNGTNYTTSIAEFSDGAGDFFLRTDGSDIGSFYEVNGVDGLFTFAAQDIDGEGAALPVSLSTIAIDVTGLSDVDFAILLAEDDDGTNQDWDDADFVNITYSLDGGAEQNLIWIRSEASGTNFTPKIDTDFDGVGDGAEITSTFTEYARNIALSGNTSITFTIEMSLNSGDEDIAFDNIRVVNGFVASPSVAITSPSNGAELAPGTTSVDVTFETTNLAGGETVNITVNGTTTNGVTSPFNIVTADGQTYDVTVELVDGGAIDSDMISFSVLSSSTVATVAELRAGTVGQVYLLSGEAIITYNVTDNGRNQRYIQDATGGILIDDAPGTLTPTLNIGDGLTGLEGQLGEFNGVLQFVPVADITGPSSTGTTITPEDVTVTQYLAAGESYESELIRITGVTFSDTGAFEDNTNYVITAGADATEMRVTFGDENLVGASIPTTMSSVIGLGSEFNGLYQVLPRYVTDVAGSSLSVEDVENNTFSMYPNPTSTGYVNILATNDNAISVSVYDILGKQVINQTLSNNRVDVSALNTGLYIVKISQNGASVTKKLVIK
ncbi:T9SS type A sorting domain-containing protein [Psychroserpens damuponensis]|uniref:T9SS type A sorting domain-containing protein n=1 Tax=Psychroserpens damuponensis TaxID=943936 RepID=UPI0006941AD7|nr:T9SS type A sorting domain-containing protein [Psychroserpens damuponensis]